MLVVLGDTDAAGVIYHATAFHWHERRFTEWLAEAGMPLQDILAEGRGLPVRRADADFLGVVRLGDRLAVQERFVDVEDTQFTFETRWTHLASGRSVLTVRSTHVACERSGPDARFSRTRLWEIMRAAIAQHS